MKEKIEKFFNTLNSAEKRLLAALGFCLILGIYYAKTYQPRKQYRKEMGQERKNIEGEITKLKMRTPDLEIEKQMLLDARRRYDVRKTNLAQLEAELLPQARIPQLLAELIKQAEESHVEISALRPRETKGKDYPYLSLEVTCYAQWENLIRYLERLEKSSQFLAVTDISVEEAKGKEPPLVTLNLKSLLAEKKETSPRVSPAPLDLARNVPVRDILLAPYPQEKDETGAGAEAPKMKIAGIIWQGGEKTAIIDGEVVKVGDKFAGKEVKDILPGMIILREGEKDITIRLEGDEGETTQE